MSWIRHVDNRPWIAGKKYSKMPIDYNKVATLVWIGLLLVILILKIIKKL